jgi:hypothetical protein
MKNLNDDLLKKIAFIGKEVKQQLYQKGFVVPVKNKDGSINFGNYKMIRNQNGFYDILDFTNDIIITGINLPQTAVVLANKLALGYYKDSKLITEDKYYGYADFEEQLYKRALSRNKKSLDYFDVSLGKYSVAKDKKKLHKRAIINSYEKLIKLI